MDIDSAWDIIERVLQEHLPEVAETLRGPANDEELSRLKDEIGRDLPEDLVASLHRHDGQDNPTQLLDIFDHNTLLSIDAMIEKHELNADVLGDDIEDTYDWMEPDKVRTIPNSRGWLQFTSAEGNGYAIDLDPLPAGQIGQILYLPIDGPTPAPEFSSYLEWISTLAQRLESGEFTIEGTGGLWLNQELAQ